MAESIHHDGPMRVLLIEDDEDDYVLTRGLLTSVFKDKVNVQWSRNFDDGLTRVVHESYDVALVDFRLGSRDGVQLIREARQNGAQLSIILLTGQDDREIDLAATAAGASDFLCKTEVTSAMLERAIRYSMQNAKLEEHRVRLLAERAARAEAEARSRAKDRFLATLSHELRTPLTPVMMAVSAMTNDPSLPPALRLDLDMIRRNIELEARLIDDLLDITRITRGALQLRSAPLDVHLKLREAIKLCQSEISIRKLIVTNHHDAERADISGDPGRIQQIFWNLVHNAVKFTPPGGRIEISTRNENDAIVIDVKDTGIGIEPEILPKVFDAFVQAEFEQGERPAADSVNGGLGLGLAISKAVADLHGGSLSAFSAGKGTGATLTLRLPLTTQPASPPPGLSPSPSPVLPQPILTQTVDSTRKPRILFVEDHVDTAMALVRVLKRSGYDVYHARTVADASDAVRAGTFDLMISDIGLPDGTGLDVMRALRESHPHSPAVAVSGYGMSEDIESAHDAGFSKYLTKPVHPDVLIATVESLLPKPAKPNA